MRILVLLLLVISFTSLSTSAAQNKPFTKEQTDLLNAAQDYLARVKTVHANFIQTNPGTDVISSGEIYISKPGKLKMSYAAPFQIDYYVIDDDLLQYDYQLDEVARGEAPENPLKVLLYDDLSLTRNDLMDVLDLNTDGQTFSILMVNRTNELRDVTGLVLKFKVNPIGLLGITRIDNEGNKTETDFTSVKINETINDSEFIFKKAKPAFPGSKN